MRHTMRTLALATLAVVAATPPEGPRAQTVNKAPQAAAKKVDPAIAAQKFETGVKAHESGKHDAAITGLTGALAGGGLPSQKMAKAFYYRGLSYRKQGKPAQAISDLTSAIWLKGGLSDTERAVAIENRSAAYREAGLVEQAEPASVVVPSVSEPKKSVEAAKVASGSGGQSISIAPSSSFGGVGSFFSNMFGSGQAATSTPPPAAPPQAPAPEVVAAVATPPEAPKPASAAVPDWQTATAVPQQDVVSPSALSVAPVEPAAPAPSATGGIGSFFSNIFGSSSGSGGAPAADGGASAITTGSAAPAVAVSSWDGATTEVSPASAPKQTGEIKTASLSKSTAVPKAAATPVGKYRLQVAAVRSKDEAEALAARLRLQHGAAIGVREPVIDETVFGNMGTFYRVRLGPYAESGEPRQLCASLKTSGFDCLLVTQ